MQYLLDDDDVGNVVCLHIVEDSIVDVAVLDVETQDEIARVEQVAEMRSCGELLCVCSPDLVTSLQPNISQFVLLADQSVTRLKNLSFFSKMKNLHISLEVLHQFDVHHVELGKLLRSAKRLERIPPKVGAEVSE